ncbi:hypothetical protein BC829DRAFT_443070 [Chytridium lagenaria]|nr:hypothetical protein BC829DRAFT_443070 [Chytridium lagenaria]
MASASDGGWQQNPSLEAAINLANKEFIKGFIAGQVIICILLFFFVKVFLLRNEEETKIELAKRRRSLWKPKSRAPSANTPMNPTHPPESCDWINVLVGQVIAKYRSDPAFSASVVGVLDETLNGMSRPSFLGPISITDFSLGDEYPILKSARMRFAEHSSNLTVIASLPVSLNLSVIKFSGTLALEFVTHPETAETYMAVSILEDFLLDFEVRSLLGHRTKVKDLPKLTSLITSRLRSAFMDEIVWPSFKRIHVPATFSEKHRRPSMFQEEEEGEGELNIGDSASVVGAGDVGGERMELWGGGWVLGWWGQG